MKKAIRCLIICFVMFYACFMPVAAQEAFIIKDANINMVVNEDGTIDITEKFDLNFTQPRHGFFRYIPTRYDMKWMIDGKTERKQYYFPVKNITCSTTCSVRSNSEGITVKLGDKDRQVVGRQPYTISYTVKTKDLDVSSNAQTFYWNLINNFDTKIEKFSYSIKMPKAFDTKQIYTYVGLFAEGDNDKLSQTVNGTTITGTLKQPLMNYEEATIKVNLPDHYFQYPPAKDFSGWAMGIGVFIAIVSILLFLKFGKDDEVFVTVEFKAPEGLDSASVGYVIDNNAQNKDILSLIIEWANHGFLLIHDEEKGFLLEKLKDMDESNSRSYEREFFNAIFATGDLVNEQDLKNQKVYEALLNASAMLMQSFRRDPKKRIYSSISLVLQGVMIILIVIPSLFLNISNAYAKYEILQVALPYGLPSLFLLLTCIPWVILMHKRYVMKRISVLISSFILLFLNGTAVAINGILQYTLGIHFLIILGMCILTFLLLLIMIFMDKRTKQSNLWLGQILGLKEFIISCEKDQLELLAEQSPTAFFDVLPYAYVLGVSDVWVKKFESIVIAEPNWYRGYGYGSGDLFTTMLWWNHFHYCFSDISSSATYIPPSTTGSGGGFLGGGGGGGGFSGGGFGGGGGGSW